MPRGWASGVPDAGHADAAEWPLGFPGCARCRVRRSDVCWECFQMSTPAPAPPACPVCGQGLARPGPCLNRWCGRADRAFAWVAALGSYSGALRRAVVGYKYGGQRWWGDVFARLLAGMLLGQASWFEELDLLVGVPAFLGPGSRRSWDPIASLLGRLDGLVGDFWDIAAGTVVKDCDTTPMSGTSRFRRAAIAERELRSALRVPDVSAVRGRRVIVVDDVFTEGSTLQEVARVLLESGAAEVAGLVLARGQWSGGVDDRQAGGRTSGRPGDGR